MTQSAMMDVKEILGMDMNSIQRKSNQIFDIIKESVDSDENNAPILNVPKAVSKLADQVVSGDAELVKIVSFHAIKSILDNLMTK